MGTPGVPLSIPKDLIAQSIKKNKGRSVYIAKDLNCWPRAIMKLINKDPELIELLEDARNQRLEERLDNAENALDEALQDQQEINIKLKSAMYLLNNLGASRGYAHPESNYKEGCNVNFTSESAAYRDGQIQAKIVSEKDPVSSK